MSKVIIEGHDRFAVIRMNSGVTNAINPELVNALSSALEQVRGGYKGMILAGGEKFFCIGFDVPALMALDKGKMDLFLSAFDQLIFGLFTVPMPTISLMAGHAIGGGNILSLTSDFRLAAGGGKLIGLNEVKLGLPVPYLPDLILRRLIGDMAANNLLYHGEMISMTDAHKIGLVDDVVSEKEAESFAFAKMDRLAALPGSGFWAIKANRVEAIQTRWLQYHQAKRKIFIECWFSETVQDLLKEAAKKF